MGLKQFYTLSQTMKIFSRIYSNDSPWSEQQNALESTGRSDQRQSLSTDTFLSWIIYTILYRSWLFVFYSVHLSRVQATPKYSGKHSL